MVTHTSYGCCTGGGDGDDEHVRWMRATIAEVGWAVVAVDAEQAHAFTVGLWHSFDLPELVMFGLEPSDMQIWLNDTVRVLRERGDVPDDEPFEGVLDQFPVLLRPLDQSWKAPLLGAMCNYYGSVDVPVRQVVWPDREGRWPWDDRATATCKERQLRGWIPVDAHPEGGWRLVGELAMDWPFERLQPDTMVMASPEVVTGKLPIVAVTHDDEGGWDFLDERGYADDAVGWVHFGQLYRDQPWLARFADLPADTQAWLGEDGEWRQRPFGAADAKAAGPAAAPDRDAAGTPAESPAEASAESPGEAPPDAAWPVSGGQD